MSKGNGWVPVDKMLAQDFKYIKRPLSRIEAMFSYTVDLDNGIEGTIAGYATQWGWSRNKVRRFVNCIRTEEGHLKDSRRTAEGHPIRFIDNGLWSKKDRRGTEEGQQKDTCHDTTIEPNPKPDTKDTPLPPKGKIDELKDYLLKTLPKGMQPHVLKITEFYQYRQQKPKNQKYKSEKGINGLYRDLSNCMAAGYDIEACMEITMERNWQTPSVDYFKSEMFLANRVNGTKTREQVLRDAGISA